MIKILREEDIKHTRKPHRCFGCLKVIPAGSPAHIQVNTDMGIGAIYTHPWCEKIIKDIDYDHDDGLDEGCVLNELSDLGFTGTPEEYAETL
jgi:hypothetical protein